MPATQSVAAQPRTAVIPAKAGIQCFLHMAATSTCMNTLSAAALGEAPDCGWCKVVVAQDVHCTFLRAKILSMRCHTPKTCKSGPEAVELDMRAMLK